ncbi:MAG: YCF48-related protein, partial [Defluviitaleaceae bacterium]|nr:YCF48-related protein [Defluviitaleaceae bacterium]
MRRIKKKVSIIALMLALLLAATSCQSKAVAEIATDPPIITASASIIPDPSGPLTQAPSPLNTMAPSPAAVPSPAYTATPVPYEGVARSSNYSALFFLDEKTGWVLAGDELLKTDDGGNTWDVVSDIPGGLGQIDFVDDQTGWAVEGGLFKTTDGGIHWTQQSSDLFTSPGQFSNLRFFNANEGYVISYEWVDNNQLESALLHTTDGGASWQDVTPAGSDLFNLRDVSFIDAANGWACGNEDGGAVVYKTTDNGATWTLEADSGQLSGGVMYMDFVDDTHGWILMADSDYLDSNSGTLYQTTDGGKSFQQVTGIHINRPSVTGMLFTGENTGWITTDHGAGPISGGIDGTWDGGQTFICIVGGSNQGGAGDLDAVNNIVFPTSEVGFAIGSCGYYNCLICTTDGGKTWRQLNPVPTDGITFVDNKYGFGCGIAYFENTVLRTTDGGVSWSILPSPEPDMYYDPLMLSFLDQKTGFAIYYEFSQATDPTKLNQVVFYKTIDGGNNWSKITGTMDMTPDYASQISYFRMFDA